MTHVCQGCGLEHEDLAEPTEPVIVDTEPVADASVRVAEIEADRDVTIARISAKTEAGWQEGRITELEAQLLAMRETLDRVAPPAPEPDPDPEPVVLVDNPEPEPVIEEPTAVPPTPEPAPPKPKKGNAFWR